MTHLALSFVLSFETQILKWMKAYGVAWDWKLDILNLHSVTVKADKTKVLSSPSCKLFHESSYSPLAERSAFRKVYPRVKCPRIVFYHSFQLSQSNTKKGIMQWTKFILHFVVFVHRTAYDHFFPQVCAPVLAFYNVYIYLNMFIFNIIIK